MGFVDKTQKAIEKIYNNKPEQTESNRRNQSKTKVFHYKFGKNIETRYICGKINAA